MADQNSEIKIVWPILGNTITTKTGMEYIIGPQLDAGGFSLVFEGTDLFGNAVALKVFKPANRPFDEVQNQWDNERKLFEKLRHSNIVAIYDAFICDNLFNAYRLKTSCLTFGIRIYMFTPV